MYVRLGAVPVSEPVGRAGQDRPREGVTVGVVAGRRIGTGVARRVTTVPLNALACR